VATDSFKKYAYFFSWIIKWLAQLLIRCSQRSASFKMLKKMGIYSAKDIKYQALAKAKKLESPGIGMDALATHLEVSYQYLNQILVGIGEWTVKSFPGELPRGRGEMVWFPSHERLRLIKKLTKGDQVCCQVCGITHWQGVEIINLLDIDHISGDRGDNSLANLRAICQNCHGHATTKYKDLLKTHPSFFLKKKSERNLITNLSDLTSEHIRKRLRTQSGEAKASWNSQTIDDIVAGKHPKVKTSRFVDKLIGAGLKKQNYCESCHISSWRGIPIGVFLQGHHLDGNKLNNQVENIEVSCQNCHYSHHRSTEEINPALGDPQGNFLSPNATQLDENSDLVKKVRAFLADPDCPTSMEKAAELLGLNFKVLKRIAKKLDIWKPQEIPWRTLDLSDPEIAKQAQIIRDLKATPGHTRYGVGGLKKAMSQHGMKRKRYLALYDRV
jgi:hypothetical protein